MLRQSRVRFSLRCLMALVAVAAVVVLVIKLTLPAAPRYRFIEVFHRKPNGSPGAVEMMGFDLDAPADNFHGLPDGATQYRKMVARLKASKAEYRITRPRGFQIDGRPIY